MSLGNAWAAAGMLRVHQTLNHSSQARQFQGQQANLTSWINEILEASWAHQVRLFPQSIPDSFVSNYTLVDHRWWLEERH